MARLTWIPVAAAAIGLSLLSTAAAQSPPPPPGFQPLNLLVTPARIADVQRVRATNPTIGAAYQGLMQHGAGLLGRTPNPIQGVLSVPGFYTGQQATQQRLTRQLRGDAAAAHGLALAAAFGASPDHARKAEEFLFAWVDQLTDAADGPYHFANPHGDTALVIAYSFPRFCYAYDILRSLGRIDAAEQARFEQWLGRFVRYVQSRPGQFIDRWNNHHSWKTLFLLCAAHVVEDPALFDDAVRAYRQGLACQVDRQGAMWRELIRGKKAATYTVMCLEAMLQTVVIAKRHGYDLTNLAVIRRSTSASVRPGGGANALKSALDLLADFIDDPVAWRRFLLLTRTRNLNGPAVSTDWGWLYELPAVWWGDPRYSRLIAGPYGAQPPRAYTLSFATLLFRPV
jgi:hypothetical protein